MGDQAVGYGVGGTGESGVSPLELGEAPLTPAAPRAPSAALRDLERAFRFESRSRNPGLGEKLRIVLETPGVHAVLVYRLGAWVRRSVRSPLLRLPLAVLLAVLRRLCSLLYGIDSTGVLEIIGFLETEFGIEVEDRDAVPGNLDSIARIAAFVARKAGAGSREVA